MGFFTQMLTPAHLAQLTPVQPKGPPMINADRALMTSLTTQLCDALDALTDALHEVRDELRANQNDPLSPWAPKEHILVPPPPLPGPSL